MGLGLAAGSRKLAAHAARPEEQRNATSGELDYHYHHHHHHHRRHLNFPFGQQTILDQSLSPRKLEACSTNALHIRQVIMRFSLTASLLASGAAAFSDSSPFVLFSTAEYVEALSLPHHRRLLSS